MEGTLGRFRQGLCRLWILIEGWAVAGAVLVLCYQTLVWLRSGSWPDVSARVAWTALGGGYPPVMPARSGPRWAGTAHRRSRGGMSNWPSSG